MVSLLLPATTDPGTELENNHIDDVETAEDIAAYPSCLVGNYMA